MKKMGMIGNVKEIMERIRGKGCTEEERGDRDGKEDVEERTRRK